MKSVFSAEIRRILLTYRRYPTETIAQILIAAGSFFAFIFGSQYIVGMPILGNHLSDLVVSYVLWMLILNTVGDNGFAIAEEAESGTLEQLYLSRYSPVKIFLVRSAVNIIFSLLFVLVVLILLLLLIDFQIKLSPAIILPVLLALLVAMGVGLLVASLAIVFKRVSQLLTIIQFGFLFLIVYPFAKQGIFGKILGSVLSMTPIYHWLSLIVQGQSFWIQNGQLFLISMLNAIGWFAIGILVYRRASNRAQEQGTLGHY
ncbi:MAG: ABC transporter permease [Lactobacillaceae bacterium]|jgi:ABC-2 type transport system permease protein|nr:ABC transporter permease [Lactobacillaceae bacterium]